MAGVHAFNSNEILLVLLVLVLVSENDLGKGGTAAGIMHDVLYNSLDVSKKEGVFRIYHAQSLFAAIPSTYPLRSAKSKVLKAAGETLFEVWALKIVLPPRRCTKMKQQRLDLRFTEQLWEL